MAGVMGGTAILKGLRLSDKLKTITLTINNDCNLNCPHCYLQYNQQDIQLSEYTVDAIFNAEFEHLAIVGKEPLLNQKSIDLVGDLTHRAKTLNKTVSIITNGLGLHKLPKDIADNLDYIDVSFDGGPETYGLYRKGSFSKIMNGIAKIQAISNVKINILHTLSDFNIDAIDDMMKIDELAIFNTIMFSPYMSTVNDGSNAVQPLGLKDILEELSKNRMFKENNKALMVIDIFENGLSKFSAADISELLVNLDLQDKVILIDKDPLRFGIIRVTFDDYVLTPYESVHPSLYKRTATKASENSLNKVFERMMVAV